MTAADDSAGQILAALGRAGVGLSDSQKDVLRQALHEARAPKRHAVEVRGLLPLFYASYYFVILAGRDSRAARQRLESGRRQRTALFGGALFASLALSPLLLAAAAALYLLKSALGIDLLPEHHLLDLFR